MVGVAVIIVVDEAGGRTRLREAALWPSLTVRERVGLAVLWTSTDGEVG